MRAGPRAGDLGVVVTFGDVTEIMRLRTAEATLQGEVAAEHAKLQAAYLRLEDAADRARRTARRTNLVRTVAIVAIAAGLAAIVVTNWSGVVGVAALRSAGGDATAANDATFTVTAGPVTSRVAVVGIVDAGSVVSVVGPFDGLVREKHFTYGGQTERGTPLLTLDTSDIQVRLRDAEAAEIKAQQHVAELYDWNNGPDVSRARRTLASADLETGSLGSRLAQTKMLLSKGIVAADEYNQMVQQQRNQQLQTQAARQDLDATLARGSADNVRIGEFELLNAQTKVQDLRSDLAHATVPAPVSGVVLQPPEAEGGKRGEMIAVGSRVTKGQTMFTIGDLETFLVRAKVDEIDINKIRIGQTAVITGDAFDEMSLNGTVTAVAAQAAGESTTHSGMATFPVEITIPALTPEQRSRVHVGMSANVSVVVYDNPAAIVVPPAVLRDEDGRRVVRVRRDGHLQSVPVTLGISTPDGIEIRRGLAPGDVVELGG